MAAIRPTERGACTVGAATPALLLPHAGPASTIAAGKTRPWSRIACRKSPCVAHRFPRFAGIGVATLDGSPSHSPPFLFHPPLLSPRAAQPSRRCCASPWRATWRHPTRCTPVPITPVGLADRRRRRCLWEYTDRRGGTWRSFPGLLACLALLLSLPCLGRPQHARGNAVDVLVGGKFASCLAQRLQVRIVDPEETAPLPGQRR